MKYDAFISYSHSDCGTIAPAIQKAIENIGKPWYQLKRSLNVFRDKTNLGANPHLWENIEKALEDSDNFIFLASPKACESDWIPKEIEKWKKRDPKFQKFKIVVTSGTIDWDKRNNDFDWKKTTCLPKCLKGKFQSEPLYINLSEFVNKKNRPIDYKSKGFNENIVIVIAGIKGVEPRDVESDEKKRKNNTIFALTIGGITFVSISILGYMFYQQKEINERNAIANNLIAEGNKYRDTDINKALLFYAYAFQNNSSKEVFKLLNDFYESKTNIYYSYYTKNNPEEYTPDKVSTQRIKINLFYKKIKYFEKIIKVKEEFQNNLIFIPEGLSENRKEYCPSIFFLPESSSYYSFNYMEEQLIQKTLSGKILNILKLNCFNQARPIVPPNSENFILEYYNNNFKGKNYVIYDTHNWLAINIDTKDILKSEENNIKTYTFFSQNAKKIIIVPNPNLFETDGWVKFTVYDIKSKIKENYSFDVSELITARSTPDIEKISISNNADFFYIQIGDDIYQHQYIFSKNRKKEFLVNSTNIYNLTQRSTIVDNIYWIDNYLIKSVADNIFFTQLYEFDHLEFEPNRETLYQGVKNFSINDITCLNSTSRYIIIGQEKGMVSILFNPNFKHSDEVLAEIIHVSTFNVSNKDILRIYSRNEDNLYIVNKAGEIYELELNNIIELQPNSNTIINQLLNHIGIEDLTKQEKLNLNIIQKDNSTFGRLKKLFTNQ